MTVASVVDRVDYTGNGAVSSYSYTFKILSSADIAVFTLSGTTETQLTLTTDFTVSGAGVASGGTISLVNGPLASSTKLVIMRDPSILQSTALSGQRQFFGSSVETGLDRLAMIAQMINEAVDRCIKFPATDSTALTPTVAGSATRAGCYLIFDSSGNVSYTSASTTLSVPSFTAGRIPFATAATTLGQSSSLTWDNTNLIHSTKGAVSPGGIDLRARTSANDGMPNWGDASIVGDGWMRIYGHGTNEFMDLSYYKYGSTITVRNLRGSAGAECALEIHGWNGTQPTAIVTFVRAVNATPDYCDIQVRNPTDTDGLALFMYASGAEIYPITATTMKLGVATTPYAEFQTDKFNLKSTTVLGWLNGAVLSGTATTAAVDCSIARSAAGLLNINGGTDPGSINKGMTLVQSSVNGIMGLYIQNTDNTNAGSHAEIWLQNGGNSGGNAFMRFTNQGVIDWTSGLKRTTNNYHFSVSNTLGTADTLVLAFGGAVQIANIRANGQNVSIESVTELTTIAAAATTDTAIQIPANAVVLGVSVRNTVAIPTATTYTVTGTSSGTVFNTVAVPVAINTTDTGTKAGAFYNATAQTIRITPNGTPGTNVGRVRVTIHYYLVTAPTS